MVQNIVTIAYRRICSMLMNWDAHVVNIVSYMLYLCLNLLRAMTRPHSVFVDSCRPGEHKSIIINIVLPFNVLVKDLSSPWCNLR